MFGRGRERNGLVTREEKGQLGKRQEEEEERKVVSRSRQRLLATCLILPQLKVFLSEDVLYPHHDPEPILE